MITCSYNVRGLGGGVKRRRIRELVNKERLDVLALQETKLGSVEVATCRGLWGGDNVRWVCNPALGRSGGLLILWNGSKGKLVYSFQGQGFLGVCLDWGEAKIRCIIINVYAPCNLAAKKQLWVEILVARWSYVCDHWCILGDFNSVRSSDERRGVEARQNRAI
jgi:exonuclease III